MGAFVAPIGYRVAYDTDGTSGYYFDSGVSTPSLYNNGDLISMNNESNNEATAAWRVTRIHGLIFPELRDIDGYYLNLRYDGGGISVYNLQTSPDTTNGVDGTWTTRISNPAYNTNSGDNGYWRQRANAITPLTGIKGIRFFFYTEHTHSIRTWHLYGLPAAGQNPDRLIFWKPSTSSNLMLDPADLDPGDAGDVMRGQTYDKTFRIKNNSSTLTATNVTVSRELLTDNTPSVGAMYSMSYQGGAFAPTVVIPSILPGGLSDDITLRLIVDPAAVNAVTSPRLRATPESMA